MSDHCEDGDPERTSFAQDPGRDQRHTQPDKSVSNYLDHTPRMVVSHEGTRYTRPVLW
jgi:hypothetical protein